MTNTKCGLGKFGAVLVGLSGGSNGGWKAAAPSQASWLRTPHSLVQARTPLHHTAAEARSRRCFSNFGFQEPWNFTREFFQGPEDQCQVSSPKLVPTERLLALPLGEQALEEGAIQRIFLSVCGLGAQEQLG